MAYITYIMKYLTSGKPVLFWQRLLVFSAFFFAGLSSSAQHDVALEKQVDRDSVAAGDTVTWTITVFNQNATNVAGLQVRDTLLPGLTYLGHVAPPGTTYDESTGIWMVGNALDAGTSELSLTITTRVQWEGMYMNMAEVVDMAGTDTDSTPNNEELLEDDMDKACVSVPIVFCSQLNDSVRVTLLPMFTGIQWYKDGVIIPANQGGTQDTFYITSAGNYAFTALQNGCPTLSCCPVVVKDSCYDLALRLQLATGQGGVVPIGSDVDYQLEIFNQSDLPATGVMILENIDLTFFDAFESALNLAGLTGGDVAIPYVWSALGSNGKLTLNGTLWPGQVVTAPVTLTVHAAGTAPNFAEILMDDGRDLDSQPESQEMDGNADLLVDNEINNAGGDEDDHDIATIEVMASGIGDFVWLDANHNGQQDSGETGLEHVTIQLFDLGTDGVKGGGDDNLLGTTDTDVNGYYYFPNLPPGNYYLLLDLGTLPLNHQPALHNNGNDVTDSDGNHMGMTDIVTLALGEMNTTLDFGIEPKFARLGDLVWKDANENGMQDLGETGVENVIVRLFDLGADNVKGGGDDNQIATDTTNANGHYYFEDLDPGEYYVMFDISTLPADHLPIQANALTDETIDSDADTMGMTSVVTLLPGDDNPHVDMGIYTPMFDLALYKTLAPGQSAIVNIGEEVRYSIKIVNEGFSTAYHIDITDHLPPGMVLSLNDTLWVMTGPSTASHTILGPLATGEADSVEIILHLQYAVSGAVLVNVAEILSAEDANGIVVEDVDSTPDNNVVGEDDIDDEPIELLNHDPTGWIYCDKTGRVITGGTISVVGPNGIPNDEVVILHDGSEGFYEFYAVGPPGVYSLSYSHPGGVPMSTSCLPQAGTFDPSGMGNVTFGADTIGMELADADCALNPYYLSFDLENGDPPIFLNNIPVRCIFIGSVVCEDTNHNDQAEPGDPAYAGLTVYLYHCADTLNPIHTTFTNAYGEYHFDGLVEGDYRLQFIIPGGYRPVTGSNVDEQGFTPCITLNFGECDTSQYLCLYACPPVSAGPNVVMCIGDTVQMQAVVPWGNGSFKWTPANILNDPDIASPQAYPLSSTELVVIYDDGLNCTDQDTVILFAQTSGPFLTYLPIAEATAECSESLPYEAPVFTDSCDANLMILMDSVIIPKACGYHLVRTWTATNVQGLSASFSQTIIVNDHTPPELSFTHPLLASLTDGDTLTMECSNASIFGANDAEAQDDCSQASVMFMEGPFKAGDCATDGYLVLMECYWIAKDACGNADTTTIYMKIVDTTAPVFTSVPQNMTIDCNGTMPAFGQVTAEDDCNDVTLTYVDNTTSQGNCTSVITRTWTATDDCGNTATATQTITVTDNTAPVLAGVPANLTLECGQSIPAAPAVTATDNCDTTPTVTMSETTVDNTCGYTLTRTWTAVDDCGNTASLSRTITVTDTTDPVLAGVPADLTVDLTLGQTIPAPATVTVTDNCDATINVIYNETTQGSGCEYQLIRTWTATDNCGNSTSATQTITVLDGITVSVNTTPDTCDLSNGTAILTPATYSYAWSDGGSGAIRSGLASGTYTVTATQGNCSEVIEVTIGAVCPCIPAVVTSVDITDATCGNDNGSATIQLAGNESDYSYFWIPNQGTANAAGNGRTGLPAGHYVVLMTYLNNADCVEKVEFTLGDDCPPCGPVFEEETLTVDISSDPAQVCIPVPFSVSQAHDIYVDGSAYTLPLAQCNQQTVIFYSYAITVGAGQSGPYQVSWEYNNTVLNTVVNDMDELVAAMNAVDPAGLWYHNPAAFGFASMNVADNYGDMTITHIATQITAFIQTNFSSTPMGTMLTIPAGASQVVYVNPDTGCSDTLNLTLNLLLPHPEIFEEKLIVTSVSCDYETPGYCLNILYTELYQYSFTLNGQPYTGEFGVCSYMADHFYTYVSLPGMGNGGPYKLQNWIVNGQSHTANFQTLAELVALMNQWDAAGNWTLDPATYSISGETPMGIYSDLTISQVNTGAVGILELNTNYTPGTAYIELPDGENSLVATRLSDGMKDTMEVKIACITPDYYKDLIQVTTTDTICLSLDELIGDFASIRNICNEGPGAAATLELIPETNCVLCIGEHVGVTNGCFVICDEYGICDTTYMEIKVRAEEPSTLQPDTLYTTYETPVTANVLANDDLKGDNQSLKIIQQPGHGEVVVNPDQSVTYRPLIEYCNDYKYEPLDQFTYQVCFEDGSHYETVVYVEVSCEELTIYTGFSPNGDGVNDSFRIDGLQRYPKHELKVFNRWGSKVFESKDYHNDWSGTWNSTSLPDGTYFYLLDDGEGKTYSGYVQIRR